MFLKKISSSNASVFKYSSPDKGDLFCMLSIEAFGGGSSERLMKLIWDGVVDEYTYAQSGPLESIKVAIKSGERKLRSLLQNDEHFEESGVGLNITVFAIRGNNLYVGNLGENGIDLWREDKYVDIAEILRRHDVVAGSALIEDSDVLLVTTVKVHEEIVSQPYSYNNILDIEQEMVYGGLILLSKQEQIAEIGELINDGEDGKSIIEVEDHGVIVQESESARVQEGENISEQEYESTRVQEDEYGELREEVLAYKNVETVSSFINSELKVDEEETENYANEDYNDSTDTVAASQSFQSDNTSPVDSDDSDMIVYEPKIYHIPGMMTRHEPQDEFQNSPVLRSSAATKDGNSKFQEENEFEPSKKEQLMHGISQANIKIKNFIEFVRVKSPAVAKVLNKVVNGIGFGVTWISTLFSKIFGGIGDKIRIFFDDKYGRKPWYRNFTAKLTQTSIPLFGRKTDSKGIRIDGYKLAESRNKRIGVVVLIIVAIILVIAGVKFSENVKHENEIHDMVAERIRYATTYIDTADRESKTNVKNANDNIMKAKTEIAEAQKIVLRSEDTKSLDSLTERLQGIEDSAYKRLVVNEDSGNFELFVDTKLSIGDKSSPTDLSYYRNDSGSEFLVLADAGEKGIFRIAQYDKKVTKLPDASGKIVSPKFVEVGVSGIYVFDETNGVVRSAFDVASFTNFTTMSGLSVQNLGGKDNVLGMAIFTDNDNAYILDKKQGGVMKSLQVDVGTYALPTKYVDDVSIAQGTDLFADSSIYFTFLGGQGIRRSLSGVVKTTNVTGVYPVGGTYTAGYTWDDMSKKVFVFDRDNKRILVFERPDEGKGFHPDDLILLKQIVYRGDKTDVFANVKDIGVSYDDKEIYVLDGLKVWKIKL